MPTIYMVQGDTLPVLTVTLMHSDGVTPYVLTGATVTFTMKDATTGNVLVNAKACTFDGTSGADGVVIYTWQTGDTVTATTCNCEFQVTFVTGQILTFPAIQNDLKVVFRPD
jgi:hypothetical protein